MVTVVISTDLMKIHFARVCLLTQDNWPMSVTPCYSIQLLVSHDVLYFRDHMDIFKYYRSTSFDAFLNTLQAASEYSS